MVSINGMKRFGRECLRVFKITRKPTKVEFKTIVMVSGLGILLIGAVGFLVYLANILLSKIV